MVVRRRSRASFKLRGSSSLALLAAGVLVPGIAWAQAETQPIAPNAGQQATPDNSATNAPDTTPTGDIVVTGRRAALEAADERKKRSETQIDSVVADDAGKLPDNSITEVLQRVSGVTIVRFAALGDPDHYSVEGSGIQVRGLTGVASRLNGRDIFSANNGRALSFADVTPELMAAVDVYKASTADLIEGGTGGQVDLRTKVPFDFKGGIHIAGTGELSVGDLAKKADPSASILATDSWQTGIGRIGIIGDYAYSRLSSNSHFFRVEPYFRQRIGTADYYIPGGYDYGEEDFQRTRTGIYGAAQWAPSDSLTFTGTFFQSRYKNRSGDWGQFVALTPGTGSPVPAFSVDPATSTFDSNNLLVSTPDLFIRDDATFLPGGSISADGNKGAYRSTTTTRDYSLSFAWRPDGKPLSLSGSLQRVSSTQTYGRLDVFRDVAFPSDYGVDLSGDLPKLTEPAGAQATFDNPANYFWAASMPHDEDNHGRLDAAQLDAEYKFDNSFFRSVKIGGRYAKRTERDQQDGYNWVALGRGWNGDPQLTFANAAGGDVELHAFEDFFHGKASLPGNLYFPTDALVRQYIGDRTGLTKAPPAGFCTADELFNCSAAGPLPETGYGGEAGNSVLVPNVNETKTYAGYALLRFGAADGIGLEGNVGARVVRIENNATGSILQNMTTFIRDGQTFTLSTATTPRDGKANFTRVLPSINVDYAPTDKIKLRAAYNITLDLPSFNALRAAGSVGVNAPSSVAGQPGTFLNYTSDFGNPQLKPTTSNNIDLSFEWYPHQGNSFHVAPFYKSLKNLPVYSLTTRSTTVFFTDGTSETATAAATDFINATKKATVKGVEVGGRFFLDMLPGFLSGFGFEGNYTYIDSKNPGDLYRDINGAIHNDVPLVGLSKHNFNATLLYERKVISARVAYSWRSSYLLTTNSNGTNQAYGYYSAPGVLTNNSGIAGMAGQTTQIALPIYGDTYGQLEAGVRFHITDYFSFYVQGTNLTNSTQRTLMGGYPGNEKVGRSWFQSDRRLLTGISVAF